MRQTIRAHLGSRGPAGAVGPLLLVALSVAVYFPVIRELVAQWWDDPNYRHGFLVPVISVFLLRRRWDQLRAAKPGGGTPGGAVLIGLAGILLVAGTAASELMTSRLSLPTFLIGVSLVFRGREFTARALSALLFLYLMIPLPYIIYYKIAFPLQLLSAKISAGILGGLGVSVIRQGNVLQLPNYVLEVVEACSGLRSLVTMGTLALLIGFLGELPVRKRALMVFLAVPAALGANTFRLVVTGLGAYLVSPSFADGFLHGLSGVVVFATGFSLLLLAYLFLRRTS